MNVLYSAPPPPQELETEWERQQGQEQLLRNQLKRLQDDLRRVNWQLGKGKEERDILEEKIGMYVQANGTFVCKR